MWYSWKGHDQPANLQQLNTQLRHSHYLTNILTCKHPLDDFIPLPPALHMDVLWPVFLKNAHPLVKIFFDWEVTPVIERAQLETLPLPLEEEALINGIRLIAVLTLSREECRDTLLESKDEFLLRCQKSTEHALKRAEYAETTDKRVLQAFMLYIVSPTVY